MRLAATSRVVERGSMVYVRAAPEPTGDVTTQTREILECIDRLLQGVGSDKSKLLTAQVWLSDMKDYEAHNAAWTEWVDPDNPPVRACVQAVPSRPEMRVEIMVTAAK
jgi:enamine deaminase RidA (YjgF/YER057c/UK114 family)